LRNAIVPTPKVKDATEQRARRYILDMFLILTLAWFAL
jgi:uncharacterized membrane protein